VALILMFSSSLRLRSIGMFLLKCRSNRSAGGAFEVGVGERQCRK